MAAMTAWAEDRRVTPVPKRKAYSRVHARRNFLFWNGPWVRDACMVTVRCVAIDRCRFQITTRKRKSMRRRLTLLKPVSMTYQWWIIQLERRRFHRPGRR
jgi:hypothetical protein